MTWLVRQRAQWGGASVEKMLGALPVIAGFCARLRIRELADAACPVRDVAELTRGQVIEVLVANRLTSPAPLVHVQEWARAWAVGEAFGIEPDLLNDDRIGRALDAIAPHLDLLAGSVGLAAIEAFGLDVTRLHWDMTSISLHGDYDDADPAFARPRFGQQSVEVERSACPAVRTHRRLGDHPPPVGNYRGRDFPRPARPAFEEVPLAGVLASRPVAA
ncbi:DUF4277 domain-containing protein [Microbispora sp. H10885]|uniref:DUF4277 domain-containing protein n=1 Tax=Microbispora sp. H10885 TaxID=2729110 RepID=UPI002175CA62|nr:DUF4277 domain-containing protein [Microbispora sp. H10885]